MSNNIRRKYGKQITIEGEKKLAIKSSRARERKEGEVKKANIYTYAYVYTKHDERATFIEYFKI